MPTLFSRAKSPRGIAIAITGPDGSGKSTQTARLAAMLQERFRCRMVYLGSNQGGRIVRRSVGRLRTSLKERHVSVEGAPRGWFHTIGSSLWRLAVALRRYQSMLAVQRLVANGFIIISDRWPQNVRPGLMDGPSLPPPRTRLVARTLSRVERGIYALMVRHKPTIMIHLLCDYATSRSHKPGDLNEAQFDQRIALLEEMRRAEPDIIVVDGRRSTDEVTAILLDKIGQAVRNHGIRELHRARSARVPTAALGVAGER